MNLKDKVQQDKKKVVQEKEDEVARLERDRLQEKRNRQKKVERLLSGMFNQDVAVTEAIHSESWNTFYYIPGLDAYVKLVKEKGGSVVGDIYYLVQCSRSGLSYHAVYRPADFTL